MQIPVLALTASASVGFLIGGLLLKRYADSGWSGDLAAALSAYFVANLIFARVLVHGLGQGMVISSMIQLIFMALAGAILFDERFECRQIVGIILALVVVWLFSAPQNSA